MMRILCFTSRLCNGGVQTFLTNYAKELCKYNIYLDVVVQSNKEEKHDAMMKSLGCRIYHVSNLSNSPLKYLIDVWKILRTNKEYKIIWAHLNYASLLCLIAAFLNRIPIRICHSHSCYEASSALSKTLRFIFHRIINILATHKWACSEKAAIWLFQERTGTYIVPNAIYPEKYNYSISNRNEIRLKYGIKESATLLLCVGTLSGIKNQKFLILMMKDLIEIRKDVKLLLCGDGPSRLDIENTISKMNLKEHVVLAGNVDAPEKFMSAADMMLIPSLVEGLPLVAIESQFSGLPCIVSSAVPNEAIFTDLIYRAKDNDKEDWIKKIKDCEHKGINRQLTTLQNSCNFNIRSTAKEIANIFYSFEQ